MDALPIGGFDQEGSGGRTEHILVYPLNVTEEAANWPDAGRRKRRWTSAREAARLIAPELAPLISDFATDTDAMLGDGSNQGSERS